MVAAIREPFDNDRALPAGAAMPMRCFHTIGRGVTVTVRQQMRIVSEKLGDTHD